MVLQANSLVLHFYKNIFLWMDANGTDGLTIHRYWKDTYGMGIGSPFNKSLPIFYSIWVWKEIGEIFCDIEIVSIFDKAVNIFDCPGPGFEFHNDYFTNKDNRKTGIVFNQVRLK
ncbi:MAG: hypothetical protein ACI8VT_004392 [Saprospiraceae bacterium]|jgi:hypothetical protein